LPECKDWKTDTPFRLSRIERDLPRRLKALSQRGVAVGEDAEVEA